MDVVDLISDDDEEVALPRAKPLPLSSKKQQRPKSTATATTDTNRPTSATKRKRRVVMSSSDSEVEDESENEEDNVGDSDEDSIFAERYSRPWIPMTDKKKLTASTPPMVSFDKGSSNPPTTTTTTADSTNDLLSSARGKDFLNAPTQEIEANDGSVGDDASLDHGNDDTGELMTDDEDRMTIQAEEDDQGYLSDDLDKENAVATQTYDFDEVLDDIDVEAAGVLGGAASSTGGGAPVVAYDLAIDDESEDDDTRRVVAAERARIKDELKLLDVSERNLEDELVRIQTMMANIRSKRDSLKRELISLSVDGSKDKTWSSESFPHSKVLRSELSRVFGFTKFRELQLEVMNATICGRDCFVVLPTGSGKSLLFQLPAVVQGGVTVVISPLLSLSRDQLMNLADRGISGLMISSEQDREELKRSYSRLFNADPSLRLVYVTPEMLVQSKKFVSVLEALNRKRLLTRIVVDEAHCCSTMGHDFRPDYQKLFFLKRQFPSVPLLCVTATATVQVEEDVKRVLIGGGAVTEDWLVFRASFNRPNLRYEVIEKRSEGSAFASQMCSLVNERFAKQCGIVYCLSRKDAEQCAKTLQDAGCSARAYHAKLAPHKNRDTHEQWRTGRVRVVCATTAFGMGIDKPDVRFVIHSSLSTSIEGYAQESGRAGRDGREATCILLYRRADVSRVSQLIADKQTGEQKLMEMVRYGENCSECRRTVMGRCFGEQFDPAKCEHTCDVCSVKTESPPVKVNHTLQAENLVRRYLEIRSMGRTQYLTQTQLVDAWRGTGSSVSSSSRFKCPSGWSRSDCERLILQLMMQQVFKIHWTYNAHRTTAYVDLAERAHLLLKQFDPDHVKIECFIPPPATSKRKSLSSAQTGDDMGVNGDEDLVMEDPNTDRTTTKPKSKRAKPLSKTQVTTGTVSKRKGTSGEETPKPNTSSASSMTAKKGTLTGMFQRLEKQRTEMYPSSLSGPIQIDLGDEEEEIEKDHHSIVKPKRDIGSSSADSTTVMRTQRGESTLLSRFSGSVDSIGKATREKQSAAAAVAADRRRPNGSGESGTMTSATRSVSYPHHNDRRNVEEDDDDADLWEDRPPALKTSSGTNRLKAVVVPLLNPAASSSSVPAFTTASSLLRAAPSSSFANSRGPEMISTSFGSTLPGTSIVPPKIVGSSSSLTSSIGGPGPMGPAKNVVRSVSLNSTSSNPSSRLATSIGGGGVSALTAVAPLPVTYVRSNRVESIAGAGGFDDSDEFDPDAYYG